MKPGLATSARAIARWLRGVVLGLALGAASLSIASDLESLRRRAGAGEADAQYALADRLHRGDGVARDDVEARALVLRAARQGHLEAQRSLGLYYWRSYGGPQDKVEALKWILIAERGGNASASKVRAGMEKTMSPEQLGEAQARAEAERPTLAALELVRKSAEAGDAEAQYRLSRLYAEGRGVTKDKRLEVEWERRAAAQDHVEALGAHGWRLVVTLDGVKGDFWKGYSHLYRAGALGHVQSQRVLGMLYQKGSGVKKDLVMSLIWFDVGVMAGDARSRELREDVLGEATPEQVAEAGRRAAAWMKRPPKERTTPEGAP